jgi:hypothetical protein
LRQTPWGGGRNAGYKALQAHIDASQRQPLLTVQCLWIQYRDANCSFLGAQDGSIRQVQAAERMRSMTEDRARELETGDDVDWAITGSNASHTGFHIDSSRCITVQSQPHPRTHRTTCRHALGQFDTYG